MAVNNPTDARQALGTTNTVTHGNLYVGNTAPSNPFDISVDKAVSGSIGISVQNTSANASAGAVVELIAETGTSDVYTEYVINGANQYSVGIDNSASDAFKITTGASPSAGTTAVSITTAGVVTLPGGALNVASGGTGDITLTSHGVLIGAGTSPIAATAAGSAGQVLQSGGASADPAYSTATYPATATGTGTILRADGTNWAATTATYPNTATVSNLLYASASNVISNLATANSGVLNTNSSGVPAITNALTLVNSSTATMQTLQFNDDGANLGPSITLYRLSTTPAALDNGGTIFFQGRDATPQDVEYGRLMCRIIATTAGVANGSLELYTLSAGTVTLQTKWLNTGGQYRGNNTNTAAPAGYIGEVLSTNKTAGSGVALTSTVSVEVVNVALSAGNWMIFGCVGFTGITTGIVAAAGVNPTTATFTAGAVDYIQLPLPTGANFDIMIQTPTQFVSVSTSTTYYLNANANFSVSASPKAYGKILAVRIG